ncbi:MAG TPA: protein kinase [Bryobacteraceae bacterium]|nr:protein kinase [Bryobacteraceae bacterium]
MSELTPERWTLVESLYDTASTLPEAERDAYLERHCPDEEIREMIESLMGGGDSRLEAIVGSFAAQLAEDEDPDERLLGTQIGPWRIESILGRGGMGAVYLGVRTDGAFQHKVAIKLIRRGAGSTATLRRFRQERQILASLQHPNIARLLDGGALDDGTPYLVMEYVEGKALTIWCREHHATIDERLSLFQQVCAAVDYAHRNLIVHRDLKPGNILVMRDGTPKLLDFGIAKLIDPTAASDSPATMTGVHMLTPEYASPEQVRGEVIGTASDVYSLGCVLYELLSGTRPYHVPDLSPATVARLVCDTQPAKPSAIAKEPKLRRQLAGDLDNIILMALRKEPERRYHSAAELADDLARHRTGHPVRARRESFGYRAGKFIGRNRYALPVATLAILGLLATTGIAVYQARRADRRFQQVRSLANSFLFEFHDKIANLPGSTEARELIVKKALEYLATLSAEAGSDVALKLELAEAYRKVGVVQGSAGEASLGHTQQAWVSYQKARTILESLERTGHTSDRLFAALSSLYLSIGSELSSGRDAEGSLRAYQQALAAIQRTSPGFSGREQQIRAAWYWIATAEDRLGNLNDAIGHYAAAIAGRRTAPDATAQLLLGRAYDRLGQDQQHNGDVNAAAENLRSALAIEEGLLQADPRNTVYHSDVFWICEALGNTNAAADWPGLGDSVAALTYYRRGLSIAREMVTADPNNATAKRTVAAALDNIGDALRDSNPAESARSYHEMISIIDTLLELDPNHSIFRRMRVLGLVSLAYPSIRLGRFDEVRRDLAEALRTLDELTAKDPRRAYLQADRVQAYVMGGDLEIASHNVRAAEEKYRHAVELGEKAATDHPILERLAYLSICYERLGSLYRRESKWQEARGWYSKSLRIWTEWSQHGVSSVFDVRRRASAAKAVAECDSRLTKGVAKEQSPR